MKKHIEGYNDKTFCGRKIGKETLTIDEANELAQKESSLDGLCNRCVDIMPDEEWTDETFCAVLAGGV